LAYLAVVGEAALLGGEPTGDTGGEPNDSKEEFGDTPGEATGEREAKSVKLKLIGDEGRGMIGAPVVMEVNLA